MDYHEVANLFPLLDGNEYQELVEDIRAHGLREPIWTHEGKIIDGRNRYRACRDLGIEPQMCSWDGTGSLVAFVLSLNLKRRHLTSSQKAVIALAVERQLANEAKENMVAGGGDKRSAKARSGHQSIETLNLTPIHAAEQAATLVGTNRQYVSDAKKIATTAPELLDEIRDGRLTIPDAKTLFKLPDEQRGIALAKFTHGEATNIAQAVKQARVEVRATTPVPPIPTTCTIERRDTITHIPRNSVDLVLTDPPYEISVYQGITKVGSSATTVDFDGDDDWDSMDPAMFLGALCRWVEEWERVIRPGGAAIAFVDRARISYLWDMFKTVDMRPKNVITWVKINPSPVYLTRRNLISATECMVWAIKPGAPYTFNEVDGWNRHTVITTPIISNQEKVEHPTQKPLSVLTPLIALTTNPGQIVLDPFAGSGSTGVAALRLGRQAHLVERDADYVRLAHERIATEVPVSSAPEKRAA